MKWTSRTDPSGFELRWCDDLAQRYRADGHWSETTMVDAARKGLFMTGESLVEFDDDNPDAATGTQPLCFVEHSAHDMRIGYYRDTYVRTEQGWRLRTRAMTFIRRSGEHDSGRPHAIGRPAGG